MTVIAYDPYAPPATSTQLGVRMVSLDELLAEADFITVHLPKNAETIGLIGDRELHLVKPEVRIINAARGGIVDEAALAARSARAAWRAPALTSTPMSRARTARCSASTTWSSPRTSARARTRRRRRRASQVARSVRLALDGEFVPDAVNVQGGAVHEDLRPWLPLGEKLGRIFAALAGGATAPVAVEARARSPALDVSVLELAAMKGLFGDVRRSRLPT